MIAENWERQYGMGHHQSIFPWSDLVSLMVRTVRSLPNAHEPLRVLELGFGVGANIPLVQSELFGREIEYFGIEGSETAVSSVRSKFNQIRPDNLCVADFTEPWPFEGPFDLIFDRASVTHVVCADVQNVVTEVEKQLKQDGFYIGVGWFSQEHSDFLSGREVDLHTRDSFTSGSFEDVGPVHFATEGEVRALFKNFELLSFAHAQSLDLLTNQVDASFSFVAKFNAKLKLSSASA